VRYVATGGRLLRNVAVVTVASLGAYIVKQAVAEHRHARRLAAPVTSWPDVPLDPPAS
jgi:hypothetical protein